MEDSDPCSVSAVRVSPLCEGTHSKKWRSGKCQFLSSCSCETAWLQQLPQCRARPISTHIRQAGFQQKLGVSSVAGRLGGLQPRVSPCIQCNRCLEFTSGLQNKPRRPVKMSRRRTIAVAASVSPISHCGWYWCRPSRYTATQGHSRRLDIPNTATPSPRSSCPTDGYSGRFTSTPTRRMQERTGGYALTVAATHSQRKYHHLFSRNVSGCSAQGPRIGRIPSALVCAG